MRSKIACNFFCMTGLLVFIGVFSGSAYAELLVTKSNDPTIKAGVKLPDDKVFNLSKDSVISITKTPENETYTLQGEFSGTLNDYRKNKKCGWLDRIFGRCGKNGQREEAVGGVRSLKADE